MRLSAALVPPRCPRPRRLRRLPGHRRAGLQRAAGDQLVDEALVHVPPRPAAGDRFPVLVVAHPAGTKGLASPRGPLEGRRLPARPLPDVAPPGLLAAQPPRGRHRRRRRQDPPRRRRPPPLRRHEPRRRRRGVERRRVRHPPGLRAARSRQGRGLDRRQLPRARPVPPLQARLVPGDPRHRRHRRALPAGVLASSRAREAHGLRRRRRPHEPSPGRHATALARLRGGRDVEHLRLAARDTAGPAGASSKDATPPASRRPPRSSASCGKPVSRPKIDWFHAHLPRDRWGRVPGSHLCEELLRRGHRVICVDSLETGRSSNIEHIRDEASTSDRSTSSSRTSVDEQVDFVYHLASPASARSTTCACRCTR